MKYLLRKRFLLVTVITVAMLSQVSYALPETNNAEDVMALPYVETKEAEVKVTAEATVTTGIVSTGILNVREDVGTDQKLVGKITANTKVKINKSENGWHQITAEGVSGWVSGDYIGSIATISEKQYNDQISRGFIDRKKATTNTSKATTVISLAKQQLGKPYRYGASGPNAFDCSGLVVYAYKSVGISLPRSSRSYASVGTTVSKANLQPGDIVLFDTTGAINGVCSHLGLYVGNRQVIHAATGGRGVVYDSIDAPYYAQRYIKAVRVL